MSDDLEYRRHAAEALPAELRQAWLELAASEPAFHSPFFSPYFAEAAAGADPGNCHVTVASRKGVPVAFFPFQFANRALGRAERIGRTLSDFNGIVTRETFAPARLDRLLAASGIHQYAFDHLEARQRALGLPGEFIREGCATDLPNGFAPYWAALEKENPKVFKDTLRCEKKIEREVGPLEFSFHSSDAEDLRVLIETKRAQYRSTRVADALEAPWIRDCLARLHRTGNPRFNAPLAKLTAGGKLISLHFGLMANGVLHFWFPIYMPEFSQYSPGRLLFARLAQASDARGVHCIDQGMGSQKYKTNFTNRVYELGVGNFRRATPQCYFLRAQDFLAQLRTKRAKSRIPT